MARCRVSTSGRTPRQNSIFLFKSIMIRIRIPAESSTTSLTGVGSRGTHPSPSPWSLTSNPPSKSSTQPFPSPSSAISNSLAPCRTDFLMSRPVSQIVLLLDSVTIPIPNKKKKKTCFFIFRIMLGETVGKR
ncbi:hypothetical protein BC940DRAFT_271921 [Gongronella butleri]|nr:hypothetical protein BC940DRAFT_271921 [Gongronella butleri]